ncbi:fibronectin type III domain-containing protein [Deinococcus humi]|uniref:Tetratricopeptide (TPR) repeat protein n=1 Tax=Deinococcus humi TaxID=662880 RepID=A0A7W8JXW3_9DEIO|nr:fibronectin type III domain-containing protein [Deinococcus humi]MBB5363761.1 tetratricopeptide (TPR) repeat protein [Deinococcus humi]GGO32090.1 hypothetical protein GCM10008949_29080 [Deinococcus humi]
MTERGMFKIGLLSLALCGFGTLASAQGTASPKSAVATRGDFTVKAAAASSRSITLSWSLGGTAAGFAVERIAEGGQPYTHLAALQSSARTFTDTGLQPGRTYGYRVQTYVDGTPLALEVFAITLPETSSGGGAPGGPSGGASGGPSSAPGAPSGSPPGDLNSAIAFKAFSDGEVLPPSKNERETLSGFRRIACATIPAASVPDLAVAERNVRDFVKQRLGAAVVNELGNLPSWRDPDAAKAVAATAVATRELPKAALAFLTAARLEPTNPDHLVNAAGVLNSLRLPNEALTLLNLAEKLKFENAPMGVPMSAIALNNRAHALNLLGRYADAESKLRAALKTAPYLSEANSNLVVSLWCRGDVEGAIKAQRASLRRTPDASAGVRDVPTGRDPAKPDLSPEEMPYRREAGQPFDMSGGHGWDLPRLKMPTSWHEAMAWGPTYDKFIQIDRQRGASGPNPPSDADDAPVTKRRRAQILEAIGSAVFEPGLRPLFNALTDTARAVDRQWTRGEPFEDFDIEGEEARLAECRRRFDAWILGVHPALVTFDNATARFADAHAKIVSALIANEGDPELRRVWAHREQEYLKGLFYNLSYKAYRVSQTADGVKHCFEGQPRREAEPLPEPVFDEVPHETTCRAMLGGAKFVLKLEILDVGISCSKFELKGSSPTGAIVTMSAPFLYNAPLTLFVGVEAKKKAPLNLATLDARTGIALMVGRDGIQDVAWQASVGLKAGLTFVLGKNAKGDTTEASTLEVGTRAGISIGVASGVQFETPKMP